MGYYIRVFGLKDAAVNPTQLNEQLAAEGLTGRVNVVEGTDDSWTELLLTGASDIAAIERNLVSPGSLGEEEIEEFLEEIESARPKSAARWLSEYLPRVQVICAFQLLGSQSEEAGSALYLVLQALKEATDGIIQADNEGFSNPDGSHILWQFADNVEGPWQMAVLADDGGWLTFRMELRRPKT